jgi:hypothetical protein
MNYCKDCAYFNHHERDCDCGVCLRKAPHPKEYTNENEIDQPGWVVWPAVAEDWPMCGEGKLKE